MGFIGNAVGGLLGGILGKSAGNLNNYQKQGYNLLNYNAQAATPLNQQWNQTGTNLLNQGQGIVNQGMGYLNQARNAIQAPQSYFQGLLSGNQAQTTAALAPDINRIEGQTQNALQSTSNLSPRGGGRSGTLFNLPFQAESNISGLYNQARPMAAQGLMGVGGALGNLGSAAGSLGLGTGGLGLGAGGLGANYMGLGNQAAGAMSGVGNQLFNQQAYAGQGLGKLFGTALGGIKWPFGGGGGSSSNPYGDNMGGGG